METILFIRAIALPILIFLIKYGWPRVKHNFNRNLNTLEEQSEHVIGDSWR